VQEKGFRDDGLGYLRIGMSSPFINKDAFDRGCKTETTTYKPIYDEDGNQINIDEFKGWTAQSPDIRNYGLYIMLIGPKKD